MRAAYWQAAEEARQGLGGLSLAPPEVRALDLLVQLAARWKGRGAALEMRAELARRVQDARPYHFSAVGLWVELYDRLQALEASGASLSRQEVALAGEAAAQARAMAAFWWGVTEDAPPSPEQFSSVCLPWVLRVYAFRFGWFSDDSASLFPESASQRAPQMLVAAQT